MGGLSVKGVSKSFGGLKAVNNVSLEVFDNEILGLMGPNGAGKTTLFNILTGFLTPDEGQVFYYGVNITGQKPPVLAKLGLIRTFQVVQPIRDLTVLENIMVGSMRWTSSVSEAKQWAQHVMEQVELQEFSGHLAQDLPIAALKRLELARALAAKPRTLLLDEVMAGLNPAEVSRMVDLVARLRESGITIVIIEHVVRALTALADRLIVLHHGQMIASGSPEAIRENPEVLKAYFGRQ